MVLGIAGGVLALLLAGVLWIFLGNDKEPQANIPEGSVTGSASTAPNLINIKESDYLGRPVADVERELKGLGLNVVKEFRNSNRYGPGLVNRVQPVGSLKPDDTVTVYYRPNHPGPKVPTPDDDDDNWTTPPFSVPPTSTAPTDKPTRTTPPPTTPGETTTGPEIGRAMTDDGQKDFSG
jgi:serine/threonine-protein kinase